MKHFLWPLSHQNIWKWIHWYEYFRLDKFTNNIPVTPSCEGEEEYPNISTYSEWETIGRTIPTSRRRMRMRSSVLRLTQKKWVHCFPYLNLIQPLKGRLFPKKTFIYQQQQGGNQVSFAEADQTVIVTSLIYLDLVMVALFLFFVQLFFKC